MDPWSWICELPESPEFVESDSHAVFHLADSPPSQDEPTRSIQLIAERTFESDPESPSLTFKVMLLGFNRVNSSIWISDTCPLSSEKPFLPLVLQLLRELISLSPVTTRDGSACGNPRLLEIKPDPVRWVMDSHSPESFSCVFNLIFLTRLFWLCVCDAPTEIGSFFLHNLFGPHVEALTGQHTPVLRTFFVSVGVDVELCITRAASYALAKWLISKEVGMGLKQLSSPLPRQRIGFSYATEAHGLWVLKGYFPTVSMSVTHCSSNDFHKITKFPIMDPKETVLRYALSHQQAEAVVQFEYSVKFHESYIRVNARVDNIRVHVAKLGFHKGTEVTDMDYSEERYFPSRVRVSIGPEIGSANVTGLSLGRSTNNEEREIEVTKVIKGSFGKVKVPRVKARARMSTRRKLKDWKIERDCEGNGAVFDAILYDNETGGEVTETRPYNYYEGDHNNNNNINYDKGFKNTFTKNGGMVFGGDEFGDEVGWRIGREMEGSVLKWRIRGKIWLSYWPNKLHTPFYETRFVEWSDEVDLPLVPMS
ncbi:PREDICTED: uncharacterized protein LOC104819551 [Tarenaya hassleriana]|uniref:uncharacterized protein LOC104819551 n=1 Tax=Tarenaya hassleriana TaxID=28532 RepID=UPI00053C677D|nr:PREDICTED: uncharacterized protein LOC104819551 [Tarenaya hassleriana]